MSVLIGSLEDFDFDKAVELQKYFGLKYGDMTEDLGLQKEYINQLFYRIRKGMAPGLTKPQRALFWYYFNYKAASQEPTEKE